MKRYGRGFSLIFGVFFGAVRLLAVEAEGRSCEHCQTRLQQHQQRVRGARTFFEGQERQAGQWQAWLIASLYSLSRGSSEKGGKDGNSTAAAVYVLALAHHLTHYRQALVSQFQKSLEGFAKIEENINNDWEECVRSVIDFETTGSYKVLVPLPHAGGF